MLIIKLYIFLAILLTDLLLSLLHYSTCFIMYLSIYLSLSSFLIPCLVYFKVNRGPEYNSSKKLQHVHQLSHSVFQKQF